jgi:probable rRNA maturation factor
MPDPGDSRLEGPRSSLAPSWLTLDTVLEDGDWQSFGPTVELVAAASAALARHPRFMGTAEAEACVALSDDAAVRRLNAQFRGFDKATNVLSFPASETSLTQKARIRNLGDIVLAQETIARESAEQEIPRAHHLQHLVVHGLLHLLGFDHETEEEANEMEALEIEILSDLGIPDPYSDAPGTIGPAGITAEQRQ